MKFRPLHDRVVVQRTESEQKTAGGIIIPDTVKEKPMEGKRFGERLKWLNSQVQKLSEAFKRLKNLIYEALKK